MKEEEEEVEERMRGRERGGKEKGRRRGRCCAYAPAELHQLQKQYFVTILYAIRMSVHAYAIC